MQNLIISIYVLDNFDIVKCKSPHLQFLVQILNTMFHLLQFPVCLINTKPEYTMTLRHNCTACTNIKTCMGSMLPYS